VEDDEEYRLPLSPPVPRQRRKAGWRKRRKTMKASLMAAYS